MQEPPTSSPLRAVFAVVVIVIGCAVWLWGRSTGRNEARRLEEARPERVLPADDRLGPTVRMLLRGRMRRHAESAERLWDAFVAVDYPAIARHAEEVAGEPRLAEPADGEDPALVNTAIPPDFFVYQSALASNATQLAGAAAERDGSKVVAAFQRTAASCFSCHVHYRTGSRHAVAP